METESERQRLEREKDIAAELERLEKEKAAEVERLERDKAIDMEMMREKGEVGDGARLKVEAARNGQA